MIHWSRNAASDVDPPTGTRLPVAFGATSGCASYPEASVNATAWKDRAQPVPDLTLGPYLSGLAGHIYALRHRDYAYARAGISIEPIVRVEEHLHALRPDIDSLVQKLNRLLTPTPAEVSA